MNGANQYTNTNINIHTHTSINTHTHTHTHTHTNTHTQIQFMINEVATEVNWKYCENIGSTNISVYPEIF